jgi:hypothetical protein
MCAWRLRALHTAPPGATRPRLTPPPPSPSLPRQAAAGRDASERLARVRADMSAQSKDYDKLASDFARLEARLAAGRERSGAAAASGSGAGAGGGSAQQAPQQVRGRRAEGGAGAKGFGWRT